MKHTRAFLNALFGLDMHAARIESLANGVAGVLSAGVLSIHAIGHAYAVLAGTKSKSGIKQIDRLLSNPGVDVDTLQRRWVEFVVGARKQVVVAMDWTEFDDDDHSTLPTSRPIPSSDEPTRSSAREPTGTARSPTCAMTG